MTTTEYANSTCKLRQKVDKSSAHKNPCWRRPKSLGKKRNTANKIGIWISIGWGIVFAYLFRKEGPQAPKYLFEVEAELGIEPPDFEGELEVEEKEKQVVYHLREWHYCIAIALNKRSILSTKLDELPLKLLTISAKANFLPVRV